MKFRTSVQVSAVFPLLLAIIVALGLGIRSTAIERASRGVVAAEHLLKAVTELHSAVYTHLHTSTAETFSALKSKLEALSVHLEPSEALDPDASAFQESVSIQSKLLESTLAKLSDKERVANDAERKRLREKAESVLLSMSLTAFKMGQNSGNHALFVRKAADRFFVVLVGVAALAMAATTLGTSRKIFSRLTSLRDIASEVAKGNFRGRLEVHPGDDLAEPFDAFNTMVTAVQSSYNGVKRERDALKDLAEKGVAASDRAREGNMRLADALTRLKRAQQQIVMQERVRALEQIGLGITRDFDSILMPAVSTSDFLLAYPSHLDDRDELMENLKTISRATHEARKRVRLLAEIFHAPQAADIHPVEIDQAIEKALGVTDSLLSYLAKTRRVDLDCSVDCADVPPVEGDDAEVIEAIADLVKNAAEAMSKGGTVRISVSEEDNRISIKVKDSGDGMTPEVRQRCLEPFFSTKGKSHSGLGLTTVVAAAGRYDGTVDIESEEGKGTTITVILPAYTKERPKKTKVKDSPKKGKKLRILVIDDEEWVRKILSKALAAEEHTVDSAPNGKEGVAKVKKGKYDLIILDLAMPDMSGDEVAVAIKEEKPGLPVILLSGLGDMMLEKGEMPEGVDVILGKPITVAELRKAMDKAIQATRQVKSFKGKD